MVDKDDNFIKRWTMVTQHTLYKMVVEGYIYGWSDKVNYVVTVFAKALIRKIKIKFNCSDIFVCDYSQISFFHDFDKYTYSYINLII